MNVIDAGREQAALARNAFPEIADQWRRASTRLGQEAVYLMPLVQQDGRVDLELRLFERLLAADESAKDDEWLSDRYSTLTRYWIFSVYENLRTCRDFQRAAKRDAGAVQASERVLDRFELIRIPLAKLQPKGAHKKRSSTIRTIAYPPNDADEPETYQVNVTSYHPVSGVDPRTGSAAWSVLNVKEGTQDVLTRQGLSNEFLSAFS